MRTAGRINAAGGSSYVGKCSYFGDSGVGGGLGKTNHIRAPITSALGRKVGPYNRQANRGGRK